MEKKSKKVQKLFLVDVRREGQEVSTGYSPDQLCHLFLIWAEAKCFCFNLLVCHLHRSLQTTAPPAPFKSRCELRCPRVKIVLFVIARAKRLFLNSTSPLPPSLKPALKAQQFN